MRVLKPSFILALLLPFLASVAIPEGEEDPQTEKNWNQTRYEILEKYIKRAQEHAKKAGILLADDAFDELRDEWMRETEDPHANAIRVHTQNLEKIERFAPELNGLSATWQVTEKPDAFRALISAIGSYHGMDREQLLTLTSAIKGFEDVLGDDPQILHAEMDFISKSIPVFWVQVHDSYSFANETLKGYQKMENALNARDLNLNLGFVEKFSSCISTVKKTMADGVKKALTSFSAGLKRGANSIKKMRSSDQEFASEISNVISSRFVGGLYPKLSADLVGTGFSDCYEQTNPQTIIEEVWDALPESMRAEFSNE